MNIEDLMKSSNQERKKPFFSDIQKQAYIYQS